MTVSKNADVSMTFTKLFSSITESSVWVQDDHTRLIWITMLAMADKRGRVWGSIPGLANRARVPIESVKKALTSFLGPDEYSRTKDHDGRRIAEIDGGWVLLNYQKYRDLRDEEHRREQNREAKQRSRHKMSSNVLTVSNESASGGSNAESQPTSHPTGQPNAEAEAEAEAVKKKEDPQFAQQVLSVYEAYPRKIDKKNALRSIERSLKLNDFEFLLGRTQLFAQACSGKDPSFIPYPSTWFNGERFHDDPSSWNPAPITAQAPKKRFFQP